MSEYTIGRADLERMAALVGLVIDEDVIVCSTKRGCWLGAPHPVQVASGTTRQQYYQLAAIKIAHHHKERREAMKRKEKERLG